MSLEFEQLTTVLDEMGQSELQRLRQQEDALARALQKLNLYATNWPAIAACVALIEAQKPTIRLARPLDERDPLDAGIPAPSCPPQATLIAADGSQILPDRHAAFLYYLLNVGGIIYHHGGGQSPTEFSRPLLKFHEEDLFINGQLIDGTVVGARRDLLEIETLAEIAEDCIPLPSPRLAVMDQRLLYWPASSMAGPEERSHIIEGWLAAMTRIRGSGALLAGYLARPRRSSVLTLLTLLQPDLTDFYDMIARQEDWGNLTDTHLFTWLLAPGERSRIFVDMSNDNDHYRQADSQNEVCFFYLNAARTDVVRAVPQIARVDIPRWVADDADAVATVHALLYDQCQILGDYPYIITRADEKAVVGRQDQAELNHWIELKMQQFDITATITAKQSSKEYARAGKTRHELR